jgi:hypothetical protein
MIKIWLKNVEESAATLKFISTYMLQEKSQNV